MVVIGSDRFSGEGRPVCNVAWARQCIHLQHQTTRAGIKMAAQAVDSLPVVELKPFVKKTWSREKSLPNFYEKQAVKEESGSESPRKAGGEPPPNIARYVKELSEQRKTVDTRQSVDSTQRYRSKLHPKADFSFEGRVASEHQQDLIPSFITRHERTKTTIGTSHGEEIGGGGPSTAGSGAQTVTPSPTLGARELSNLMSAYTRDKQLQQQPVCLKGGKLSLGNVSRRPMTYLKPFSAYRHKQPWTVYREENSPGQVSPRNAFSLSLSRGSVGITSSANGVAARRDLVLSGSNFRSHNQFPLHPQRVGHRSSHKFNSKLGAARDSLSLLSRSGAPTVLERNLSYDLELRMERCRREKSFAAIGETNVLSTAHYVAYDSQPTRGEITLMRAREANTLRDGKTTYRRSGLQKPLQRAHHSSPNNIQFMLARAPQNCSPRSRSDPGDSGIQSSVGETMDGYPGLGEVQPPSGLVVIPRDIGEEVIPEQPGDCDDHYDEMEGKEVRQAQEMAGSVWVQDGQGYVHKQSADEHQQGYGTVEESFQVENNSKVVSSSAENRKSRLSIERHTRENATVRTNPVSLSVYNGISGPAAVEVSSRVASPSKTDQSGRLHYKEHQISSVYCKEIQPGRQSVSGSSTKTERMAVADNRSDLGESKDSSISNERRAEKTFLTNSKSVTVPVKDGKEDKAFETRRSPSEGPGSGSAADVELESVNSTNEFTVSHTNTSRDVVAQGQGDGTLGTERLIPQADVSQTGQTVLAKPDGQGRETMERSGDGMAVSACSNTDSQDRNDSGLGASPGLQSRDNGTTGADSSERQIVRPKEAEHDTRVDKASTNSENATAGSNGDEKIQGRETVGSVTVGGAEKQGEGFEGEETFLTTTPVEAEEWQNIVKV